MSYRNLNNKSFHSNKIKNFLQGGGEPSQVENPKDPQEELVPLIKSAIEQGAALPQIIASLAQNQIPIDIIQEALISAGIPQEEIAAAFQEIEQLQAQDQQAQAEGPIQPSPEQAIPGEQMPPEQMAPEGAMPPGMAPMMQEGGENEEMQSRDGEPVETIIDDSKDGYDYKKIEDPQTGEMTYFSKRRGASKWKDLQDGKNDRALKAVRAKKFGDNPDEWYGTDAESKWNAQEKGRYNAMMAEKNKPAEAKSSAKDFSGPTYDDILKGGYRTKVIQYPMGYANMPPGHIETILVDSKGNPVSQYMDQDGNIQDALVNRWEERGQSFAMKNDSGGDDNAGVTGYDENGDPIFSRYAGQFKDKATMDALLKSDPYIRSMDIALNPEELSHFLNTTALESGKDYHFSDNNCADGVCRAYNVDDKTVGQTTGLGGLINIGTELGLTKGGAGALTDPFQVYNTLQNKYKGRTSNVLGKQKSRTQGMLDIAVPEVHKLVSTSGLTDAITPDWLVSKDVARAADYTFGNMAAEGTRKVINGVAMVYKGGRWVKDVFEEAGARLEDARQSVIKNSSDWTGGVIDLDQSLDDAVDNTVNWWKKKLSFEKGGEPNRYSNILHQAQYGLGFGNAQTLNQFHNRDKSYRSNINSAYLPMNLKSKGNPAGAFANALESTRELFGAKDKDGDGLADGAFRDLKAKRNRHKAAKDVSKGKVPKGWENWQDKTMMKYNDETMSYDMQYNDPRFQSNIKKKNYANLFKKGKNVISDEYLNRTDFDAEGYKSFSDLSTQMKSLSKDEQDALRYTTSTMQDYQKEKKDGNLPKGTQLGMDSRGAIGYYDEDAELPGGSQKRINNMMMQNYGRGGSSKSRRLPRRQNGNGESTPFEQYLIDYPNANPSDTLVGGPSWQGDPRDAFGYPTPQITAFNEALDQTYGYNDLYEVEGAQEDLQDVKNMTALQKQDSRYLPWLKKAQERVVAAEAEARQKRFGGSNFYQDGDEVARNEALAAYEQAKAAYDAEMNRVNAVRTKTSDLARKHGEAGSSYSDVGISNNLANWVSNNGFACNTYSCQIMREAGVTIPEGTESFEMNGRTYNPGDKLPIIPGNAQFNSYADKLGFQLMPKGTMPTQEGDLIRGHMYDQPGGASSGSQHSVISAGYGDDDFLDLYNNPGGVYDGYTSRADYDGDPMRTGENDYYTTDSGVMRYVGDSNALEAKMNEAKAAYDAFNTKGTLVQEQTGGQPGQPGQAQQGGQEEQLLQQVMQALQQGAKPQEVLQQLVKMGLPEEQAAQLIQGIMQQMQGGQGGAPQGPPPGMMRNGGSRTLKRGNVGMEMNNSFMGDPRAMMQQQQQLMKLMEEVNEASGKTRNYKKKTPHDTVELTTEQIAKIMAAGGSVKYS